MDTKYLNPFKDKDTQEFGSRYEPEEGEIEETEEKHHVQVSGGFGK